MPDPRTYQFNLSRARRPDDEAISETWYPGVRQYWPKCTSRRIVHPIDGVVAVVIHATAGASTAGAVSVMKSGTASFHWVVPDEDEQAHGQLVWACVPETLAAWHVKRTMSHGDVNRGRTGANDWSLGIEIVNTQSGGEPFSPWQVESAAKIVRYCWAKYPNLKHVVSHAKLDPKNRSDPGAHFPWDDFKRRVLAPAPAPFGRVASQVPPAGKLRSRKTLPCA
jgi:N-acetylmuramoyl-L-alanine amidase